MSNIYRLKKTFEAVVLTRDNYEELKARVKGRDWHDIEYLPETAGLIWDINRGRGKMVCGFGECILFASTGETYTETEDYLKTHFELIK